MMEDERIETITHNVKELQQTHPLTFSLRCVSGYHTSRFHDCREDEYGKQAPSPLLGPSQQSAPRPVHRHGAGRSIIPQK